LECDASLDAVERSFNGLRGVTGKARFNWRFWGARVAAAVFGLALLAAQNSAPVGAAGSGDRTLWLYHTHTHESGHFTYKRNGQYDPVVLKQLDIFLADWRNHEPTRMDPRLFDLLWEVYQDVHGTQPYNIVSSYRTPATNSMLRAKSSGVAENSQHMLGKAMDVFIPGVKLATLRAAAMRHQVGGVGYYPTSGSPFVHMDTGNVRAWPRMTRAQLKSVFPDGRTLHLPVDGKPLSDTGRRYAQAEWSKCHMVPCNGLLAPAPMPDGGEVRLASLDPAQRSVSTIDITAPVPMMPPGTANALAMAPPLPIGITQDPTAIVPFSKTPALMVATRGALAFDSQTALGAISSIDAPIPAPRLEMSPGEQQMLTAYAPEIVPDPGAQRALELIIERAAATPDPVQTAAIDTSALRPRPGGTNGLDAMTKLFDLTWQAVTDAGGMGGTANTLASASIDPEPMVGLRERATDLIAPEIDHVNETLTTPVPMTDIHYAEMYEPEGYLDNAAELGAFANRIMLESDLVAPPRYDTFIVRSPMLVASRG
jgi:uncharacterized protein YcbK (DUF882 family)